MDCQMPLEKIIKKCQKLGINCIAIADHGTAEGALEMQKIAPFKVIVAEEILTTDGEIMGMFLKETIKSEANTRITPQEAIKRIREQGALANLQHPFETIRGSALKDKAIEELAENFDLVEVLNSRSPLPANSNKAKAFAEQHHIPGGAGSDAHRFLKSVRHTWKCRISILKRSSFSPWRRQKFAAEGRTYWSIFSVSGQKQRVK